MKSEVGVNVHFYSSVRYWTKVQIEMLIFGWKYGHIKENGYLMSFFTNIY